MRWAHLEQTQHPFNLQVAALKDKLVRLLADMENLRDRSARQVESAHKFAIQVCIATPTTSAVCCVPTLTAVHLRCPSGPATPHPHHLDACPCRVL